MPLIPVSILTGFLGSGKTTLLRHLLRHPRMGRTAVIINEFGEIGLDHDLIETSSERFLQLTGGCLCCVVRGDLVETLLDLAARRAAGALGPFERVVIETSGLADPAPILQALIADRAVAANYRLDRVVATVDALLGADTLDRFVEARRQAALADRIVLTKTDIAPAPLDALAARLDSLNARAPRIAAVLGAIDPEGLFAGADGALAAVPQPAPASRFRAAMHSDAIASVALVRAAPVPAVALSLFLEALAENAGPDLLRMKGLVAVAESPERPAVIHGVQHVFERPVWLDRWPSADRRTRIVFIGRGIPRRWPERLLAAIEAEVAEELARLR
ncbi:MAG: GTP-binding protein [Alphaproteobacteria bacterium]|nr:GTP-binding protein [Alphaproteobacteria bacterium]